MKLRLNSETELVPKRCCMVGCKRRAVHAKRTAGFWISWCELHQTKPAPISLNRALDCLEVTKA